MKVLKGLGVGILSFLLLLSLSFFGIAFTINCTLLNPDFVATQVDKIDISTLIRDYTEEQIGEQLPKEATFLKETMYDVIDDQEPWLKEQSKKAVYAGYDFFLGKTDNININISLEPLKTSLRDSLWATFSEYLSSDLSNLPEYLLKPAIEQYYNELDEQILKEYLPAELAGLPKDQLKEYIEQHPQEFIEQIPEIHLTPELADQLKDQLEPYFNQYYEEFAKQIPDELTVDESVIPIDVMAQMILVRKYIDYFQTGYYALIGFMVLLCLCIFLINRNVRDTSRGLGITFLIYGVLEFAGVFLARNYALCNLLLPDIPPSIQLWLAGLARDILSPLQIFSLGVLIFGVVLVVVSFVYKPRVSEE